ncbi:hypothetical protein JW835_09295 [bacterium]|nr:hypothetical protein [bacterium]
MQNKLFTRILQIFFGGIISIPLFASVGLYKHIDLSGHSIENCRMTVGDITGDGKIDYVFNDGRRVLKAFDHNGSLLWEKFNPDDPGVAEPYHNFTISIYDIDLDDKAEVICYLEINGENALAIVDGATGNVQTHAVVPYDSPRDHEKFGLDNYYMQDHVAIINLRGLDVPQDILAIHASKLKIAAYAYINGSLEQQWFYITDHWGYSSGHWAFPYDIDEDGRDEIIAGPEILDENGNELWALDILPFNPDHPDWGLDHVDAASCADVDPDLPGKEIIFVAATGMWMTDADGNELWFHPTKITDPENGYFVGEGIQEVLIGNFRPDIVGLEAVIYSEDMYADNTVGMFDRHGNALAWDSQVDGPRRWITCAIDWDGDRTLDELYSRNGIFDGQFQKLSESFRSSYRQSSDNDEFPPVVCDAQGDHREEILWYDEDEMFIMYNNASLSGDAKPSPWENLKYRLRVANMNHCSPMYFDWSDMDEAPDTTPPNSPVQLNLMESTASSLSLSWQAPPPAPDGDVADCYCIHRDGSLLTSVTETQFTDVDLDAETSYFYEIYALDECENACLTPASGTYSTSDGDGIPPNVPTDLRSPYQTESAIFLEWNAPGPASDGDEAAYYRISRNGSYLNIVTELQYLDQNLSPSTAYQYEVFAQDNSGNVSTQAATGSFQTFDVPKPNTILRDLNASVLTSTPIRLTNGMKTLTVQVSTTSAVAELPPPLILMESDGTESEIFLSGNVPGTQFSGTLIIDDSVAHGNATFQLPEGALVDLEGNSGLSDIISGSTVFIDQIAPSRPMSLMIR